jgi:hypothetical protein
MRWLIVVVLLVVGGCGGDGGNVLCDRLSSQLLSMAESQCPDSNPGCGGNPGLNSPKVPWSKTHYDVQQQLKAGGCSLPDLGSAPFLCNTGAPQCPDGYSCVADVCRRP